jgi:5-hydroxyisourate hydrolase-like protein (transthyretin family)
VYSDAVTGFYTRMIQPGNYTLKFQSPGFFDFITDQIQIANYTSSVTVNVQMIPTAPIPVELVSFTANAKKNDVELNWTTATETNNRGFEIQRSVIPNGVRNLVWEVVSFVNGNGTTTKPMNYSFVDKNLKAGNYSYRLKQIDLDGSYKYSEEVEVTIESPKYFSLEQNYPNPFNPSTVISYQLPVSGDVTLKVYDVLGNEVATLVNEEKPTGSYEVEFKSSVGNGQLANGVYFYQLKTGDYLETKKMILLK